MLVVGEANSVSKNSPAMSTPITCPWTYRHGLWPPLCGGSRGQSCGCEPVGCQENGTRGAEVNKKLPSTENVRPAGFVGQSPERVGVGVGVGVSVGGWVGVVLESG